MQSVTDPMAPDDAGRAAPLTLCVDLDGTLIRSDLLYESFIAVVTTRPWLLFLIPLWLLRGRAVLKAELAARYALEPALLPYDQRVLTYLTAEKARGRPIVLATAADSHLARAVAAHLGLFDEVLASADGHNLAGVRKAEALRARYGAFEYIGDGSRDRPVWSAASRVGVANAAPSLLRRLTPDVSFARETGAARGLLKALRPHQWSKNLLVFVPIVTAGHIDDAHAWLAAALAFVSFCATASAIYVINDLADLAADRAHPRKRRRPFASGAVPLSPAVIALGPVLLLAGLGGAVAGGIALPLGLYAAVSLTYSVWLKKLPLVDVFALAFLYVVRLIVGGVATGFTLSLWLLGFSAFLFLGLAFVKRVAELFGAGTQAGLGHRRGYLVDDRMMLTLMGVASSFAASLLLTLYVQSPEVASRYGTATILWGLVPLILFWQLRLWLSTSRGYMVDDPIVYSARDWVSWLVSLVAVGLLVAASKLDAF